MQRISKPIGSISKITMRVVAFLLFLHIADSGPQAQREIWTRIGDGLHYARFDAVPKSTIGSSRIDVVRIDPTRFKFEVKMISEAGGSSLTAPQWAEKYGLAAVTNAGMFQEDLRTHVGYLRSGSHVNFGRAVRKYLSVAAWDPVDSTAPPFRIFDLDTLSIEWIKERYRTVVQNLRLIKRPGVNVWPQQDKIWSEAALGEDRHGNVLFIFCRSPYSMHDLNAILLKLPVDLVAAQHLEGGPEASLFVDFQGFTLQREGSYETIFSPSDDNANFWPLPNVIGVRKKP